MFLTKLSLKNLIRHRNRTLITSIIIAFAVFSYIMMDSMIGGMIEMTYNSSINYETGHLQIAKQKYWDKEDKLPLENLLVGDQQLMTAVKDLKGYQASSPELSFQARLNNGTNELPVIGKGIIPGRFEKVFAIEDKFTEGEMFSPGEYKAVMGKELADLMKLKTNDYITLLVKDKNETFNTIDVEISGLVYTGNPNVNNNIVYLPLAIAQQALIVNNQVSKIIVRLDDKNLAMGDAKQLRNKLKPDDNILVKPWNQLEAMSVVGVSQKQNQLMLSIILLIAAIAIINTVILSALERMKEIGMMKAMGLQTKEIIYTFVLESTVIGILGGLTGLFVGGIGVWLFSKYGIDIGAIFGLDMTSFGVAVIGKMYGAWNPGAFLLVFAFGVFISLLSSIFPAYWASSKDPVNAINHR